MAKVEIITGAISGFLANVITAIVNRLRGQSHHRLLNFEHHVAAVEAYLDASFRYYEQLIGAASIWGTDVPLTEKVAQRLFHLVNFDYLTYRLGELGTAARSSATLLDPKLLKLLDGAETAGVNITPIVNRTFRGQSVMPILERIRKAQEANQRVAARLRQLQR